jgi:branched-chain amino acid transport system substrate-binding protein
VTGRRAARALALGAALGAGAVGLSACDGPASTGASAIPAGRLVVDVSVPMIGPSRTGGGAVLEGARMALAAIHGRVGHYRIVLRARDDATRASHGWDPGQTTAEATAVARDPRSIGYVGDLDSGASAVSLPILNRADIPQISPLSTAVGLTRGGPEASPGEPQKYYPAMRRTFARVVPNDIIQSAVLVALARQAGCGQMYLIYDNDVDGRDAANSFQAAAKRAHLNAVGFDQFDPDAKSYGSLGAKLAKLKPGCVLVSALPQDHAAQVTEVIARALPTASLFATAALADPTFFAPRYGGVPLSVDARLVITAPTLSPADYPPAGRRVIGRLARRGSAGRLDGIWGYEAMSLMLDAIRRASDDGRRDVTRTRVLHSIFATRDRRSVLGRYSIDQAGDTTLRRFGVYHVVGGRLVFWKAMHG